MSKNKVCHLITPLHTCFYLMTYIFENCMQIVKESYINNPLNLIIVGT